MFDRCMRWYVCVFLCPIFCLLLVTVNNKLWDFWSWSCWMLFIIVFLFVSFFFFFLKLVSWPRTVQTKFNFTIYPITFPKENANEWKKLFKPCASQRLFLPVSLESSIMHVTCNNWRLKKNALISCFLCISSWSWRRWILCSTWTQISFSCSQWKTSGPFFLISIRAN